MRKILHVSMAIILILGVLAACSGNNEGGSSTNAGPGPNAGSSPNDASADEISGDITFLTHRTDIVDSVFKDQYLPRFNEKYPNVTVNFEAITDYEGQVKIRMNTKDYGDVLMIPEVLPEDLSSFFEPLGSHDEMSEKYLFVNDNMYENTVYGIPIVVNAQGVVYNKEVFEAAGITDLPKSPDEFLAAMHQIKERTDAIPLYTNYAAGWTLNQWESNRTSVAGDPEYVNYQMVHQDDPFAPGKPHYTIYKLMYDLANQGLIEADPTTTDWESSKPMIANGEIATMVLGSWAITQMQEFADDPDIIGYMPFPSNVDGTVYSSSGGDYNMAVNVNSPNKEAALAWLYWFIEESGYAEENGGISPIVGKPMPSTLDAFDELGVVLISESASPEGEEGLVDRIDQQAEIGLWQENFTQRIIEAAIGNRSESFEDIANDLNERWNRAREQVSGQ